MTRRCECCGQEILPAVDPEAWGLTAAEKTVADMLAARLGRLVSRTDLIDEMYRGVGDGGPPSADAVLTQYTCRIRRKLPANLALVAVHGQGLRLERV